VGREVCRLEETLTYLWSNAETLIFPANEILIEIGIGEGICLCIHEAEIGIPVVTDMLVCLWVCPSLTSGFSLETWSTGYLFSHSKVIEVLSTVPVTLCEICILEILSGPPNLCFGICD